MTLSPYIKAVVAFIGGLAAFLITLIGDDTWTNQDTGTLLTWIGQTYFVYQARNKPIDPVGGE